MNAGGPLAGVRIVEASMLGPAALTTHLVDLGAEVIKVESPRGDYIREMTWPIVEGVSLMHLHINRGKHSIVLDLRTAGGREVFLDLVRKSDGVVEAMRPGGLERRGISYADMCEVNPRIVFATISGYGATGPYRDLASHGIAYDAWAGLIPPEELPDGHYAIPEHASMGIHAGPLYGALGLVAGILRARATGQGSRFEIAQSDAAAAMDWLRSETWRAYERPETEVTGNKADGYERRAPGTAGMRAGVRYQFYQSADGFVLFMASEREFWQNFCVGLGRQELFDRFPGPKYADHARGNLELREELRQIFLTRTTAEWIEFANHHNTAIAPVNTPQSLADDPQFRVRMPWQSAERLGADMLPSPLKFLDETLPVPARAPVLEQHSEAVLRDVLGYDTDTIARLRAESALGEK